MIQPAALLFCHEFTGFESPYVTSTGYCAICVDAGSAHELSATLEQKAGFSREISDIFHAWLARAENPLSQLPSATQPAFRDCHWNLPVSRSVNTGAFPSWGVLSSGEMFEPLSADQASEFAEFFRSSLSEILTPTFGAPLWSLSSPEPSSWIAQTFLSQWTNALMTEQSQWLAAQTDRALIEKSVSNHASAVSQRALRL